jgi:tetratricopeptide (TPR) repeat protein
MRARALTVVVVIACLAGAGTVLNRVAAPAWNAARAKQPALKLDSSVTAAGQGVTLALLGGFRALVADAAWIRMYVRWEARDLPGVETLIRVVTAIDPRPVYFWLNGARILAYDLPVWRIEAAGGFESVAAPTQERIAREQAHRALALLDAAMAFHPASPDLWVERANIELNKLRDLAAAAESFRRAWEQPHAPFYAARLYAELLRRQGKKAEALAWLERVHPLQPPDPEGGSEDVVLQRIRDLERELKVPPERAYQARR